VRFLFLLTTATVIAGAFSNSLCDTVSTLSGGVISGEFTTSLGDTYPYTISAITTDSTGNTYVVGSRQLGGAASDVFVSKLDSLGNLFFTDTFAGKGVDTGTAIALDPTGNIYIAGTTTSNDFPLSNALQTQPNASGAGFIIKLTNDGSTILYSTYFGGTLGATSISSLATDSNGNLYLTGITGAADFPHTAGMPFGPMPLQATNSGAILSSISAAGDHMLYSGVLTGGPIPLFGGTSSTAGVGVAVDGAGNAYFAGNTGQSNLPTTPGVLAPSGAYTGFLAKVNTASASLSYLTYLPSFASALAVDAVGDTYLAGYNGGDINAPIQMSLAKINPSASAILWTNNLGGADGNIQSIAVDLSGEVWATGETSSSTFPNINGWTTGPEFLVGLNSTGTQLTYSARFPAGTVGQSVAVETSAVVFAGANGFVSVITPSFAPTAIIFAFQNAFGGNATARISPAEVISIYGPGIGPATPSTAAPTNGLYPKTLAGMQVTIGGMNMPLLYVSANQINAVVPMEIAPGAATVHVINGVVLESAYPVWIVASAPQAFPTVLNQDGTFNSQTNPAHSGSIATFYATGWQSNFSPLIDGQVATMAQNVCSGSCQAVPAGVVLYGGTAPGIVAGVSQLNIQIGPIQPGTIPFQFNFYVPGASANLTQTVWVAP
jgi:uncharacterized protein (TIGR03437 family)